MKRERGGFVQFFPLSVENREQKVRREALPSGCRCVRSDSFFKTVSVRCKRTGGQSSPAARGCSRDGQQHPAAGARATVRPAGHGAESGERLVFTLLS